MDGETFPDGKGNNQGNRPSDKENRDNQQIPGRMIPIQFARPLFRFGGFAASDAAAGQVCSIGQKNTFAFAPAFAGLLRQVFLALRSLVGIEILVHFAPAR